MRCSSCMGPLVYDEDRGYWVCSNCGLVHEYEQPSWLVGDGTRSLLRHAAPMPLSRLVQARRSSVPESVRCVLDGVAPPEAYAEFIAVYPRLSRMLNGGALTTAVVYVATVFGIPPARVEQCLEPNAVRKARKAIRRLVEEGGLAPPRPSPLRWRVVATLVERGVRELGFATRVSSGVARVALARCAATNSAAAGLVIMVARGVGAVGEPVRRAVAATYTSVSTGRRCADRLRGAVGVEFSGGVATLVAYKAVVDGYE